MFSLLLKLEGGLVIVSFLREGEKNGLCMYLLEESTIKFIRILAELDKKLIKKGPLIFIILSLP